MLLSHLGQQLSEDFRRRPRGVGVEGVSTRNVKVNVKVGIVSRLLLPPRD